MEFVLFVLKIIIIIFKAAQIARSVNPDCLDTEILVQRGSFQARKSSEKQVTSINYLMRRPIAEFRKSIVAIEG